MRSKLGLIFVGTVPGLAIAATAINAADDDTRSAIEAANEVFMAELADGDAAGVAALYTEDGMLLPPGSDFVTGREAIEEFWRSAMSGGPTVFTLTTREVEHVDDTDTAIEIGTFRITDKEGAVLDSGKYLVVWKLVDGDWKLHQDIWNSNNALPEE